MSTLSVVVDPTNENEANPDGKDGNNIDVPAWGWGVIGGGIALLTTAGVATWHFVSRRYRVNRARQETLETVWGQNDITPRNGTPRDFAPDGSQKEPKPSVADSEIRGLIV